MDPTFLQARIDATKADIVATEDAVFALTTGGVASYTLDTSQSNQAVTKLNLTGLQNAIGSLYNRLATLEARRNGTGVLTVRPAW